VTAPDADNAEIAASWDAFWRGSRHGGALAGGGSTHPAVIGFWESEFRALRKHYATPRILDVASGNGALPAIARGVFAGQLPPFTCLDISAAAVRSLQQRFPGVDGIVADVRDLPLAGPAFDVAISQFGVEYAGLDVVADLARVVGANGRIAMLLHHRQGGIRRQCRASLEAIRQVQAARFLPLTIALFEAGFAAARGGPRADYEAAARRFEPAVRALEHIMQQFGVRVADDTVVRLYRDVRTMHNRLTRYEPAEVLAWLARMDEEVAAYAGRMQSMCAAAIDAGDFAELCRQLEQSGFVLLKREPLLNPEHGIPLAWALVAARA